MRDANYGSPYSTLREYCFAMARICLSRLDPNGYVFLNCFPDRPQTCGDGEGECHDDAVFDDVLAFKRGGEESLPSDLREEYERHHGRDHVRDEQGYGNALKFRDEKRDAGQHFVDTEPEDELFEREEGECAREQCFHERICRTALCDLQRSKPKENDKKGNTRERDAVRAHPRDDVQVYFGNHDPMIAESAVHFKNAQTLRVLLLGKIAFA